MIAGKARPAKAVVTTLSINADPVVA